MTTTYVSQEAIYTPKFIKIRDKKQLTRHNLKTCLDINENFKKIIYLQHPDDIANNLQLELNTIIDTVATPKIVQYRKDYQPYMNNDLQTQLNETQQLLNKATRTYEFDDWFEYKNKRNFTQKNI